MSGSQTRRNSIRGRRAAAARAAKKAEIGVIDRDRRQTVAVVDLGSRALRLAIGEVVPGKPLRRLETVSVPVAIGVDTFGRGTIRASTVASVVRTLHDFARLLEAYGVAVADCVVTATTAVRYARNREVFLDRVASGTGFRVQVIDAIEEARLVEQLMRHVLGATFDRGHVLLLALGAGGTHLIVRDHGRIRLAETFHFGMLRLLDPGMGDRAAHRGARRFLDKVVRSVHRMHDLSAVDWMVVVNSELYRLAASSGRARQIPRALELQRTGMDAVARELEALTADETAEDAGVSREAAELARMAWEEMRAFAIPTRTKRVVLPDCSMLDSLLLDARLHIERGDDPHGIANADQVTEAAAWAVARRFRVDENHAAKVRELALMIFDGLQPMTALSARSKCLLSVAAILHETGLFVSTHDHGAHSAYLIANSEIIGLGRDELARVATVARYHRRGDQTIMSIDLGGLTGADRVEVLKLIAILRLADALDADQSQSVQSVKVRLSDTEVEILAHTRGAERESFLEIERTFRDKAELCSDLFGLKARVVEVLAR